jgi:hypothetical protein
MTLESTYLRAWIDGLNSQERTMTGLRWVCSCGHASIGTEAALDHADSTGHPQPVLTRSSRRAKR